MFKHVLIPTDGSELSKVAIEKGLQLAKVLNARVTGLYVMPQYHVFSYHTEMLSDTAAQFDGHIREHAEMYLAALGQAAAAAGVACETTATQHDHPFESIIETAAKRGCDVIVMSSHGRSGMRGLLLGGETQKVLTHSKVPVLVLR